MAGDRENYERTIERLCGEVDALRSILLAVASELPERAMYHITEHAQEMRQRADADAANRPNDRRSDYAAGVWDTVGAVEEVLEQQCDELAQGARIRTVQPYPISPSELVDPKRGF